MTVPESQSVPDKPDAEVKEVPDIAKKTDFGNLQPRGPSEPMLKGGNGGATGRPGGR